MRTKGSHPPEPSFHSIAQCHSATGIPLSEIKRAKAGNCKAFTANGGINLYFLLRWLYGDGKRASLHIVDVAAAKERDLNASAALKESKMKERDGELVPAEYVQRALRETLLPVRQRLFAMPSECAHKVNPADPVHARQELQSWVDQNLPIMQEPKNEKSK